MSSDKPRTPQVRRAQAPDTAAIIMLGEHFHQESFYSHLPYDGQRVADYISYVINNPANYCLYVADMQDQIIGVIGGYLDHYLFCDERVAYDTVFYVEKQNRGSLAAKLLVNAFREWAMEHHACEICLGISSGINTERVGKFYERLGFTCVGSIYKLRLR